jgi:hypothetical protein
LKILLLVNAVAHLGIRSSRVHTSQNSSLGRSDDYGIKSYQISMIRTIKRRWDRTTENGDTTRMRALKGAEYYDEMNWRARDTADTAAQLY